MNDGLTTAPPHHDDARQPGSLTRRSSGPALRPTAEQSANYERENEREKANPHYCEDDPQPAEERMSRCVARAPPHQCNKEDAAHK